MSCRSCDPEPRRSCGSADSDSAALTLAGFFSHLEYFPIEIWLHQEVGRTQTNWWLPMTNSQNVFELGTARKGQKKKKGNSMNQAPPLLHSETPSVHRI